MKFGPLALKDAGGALLAHSVRVERAVFRKGRLLSVEDLEVLAQAGVETVTAARFEPGDMDEDSAAAAIAAAVAGEGLEVAAPFTGRVNLFAEERGVLTVESDRVDRLNLLDESITLATLPPYSLVERR
ncbi:MAG: 4-diphosphocytidyl-2C-methyl-D-erythritol kinase, partial [Alphaproteobacteria bacterium]|nr:4-diphosphocytidyl-2C-methyl-D-erythritol kinase [Alphaproteobacteria bacterium]